MPFLVQEPTPPGFHGVEYQWPVEFDPVTSLQTLRRRTKPAKYAKRWQIAREFRMCFQYAAELNGLQCSGTWWYFDRALPDLPGPCVDHFDTHPASCLIHHKPAGHVV